MSTRKPYNYFEPMESASSHRPAGPVVPAVSHRRRSPRTPVLETRRRGGPTVSPVKRRRQGRQPIQVDESMVGMEGVPGGQLMSDAADYWGGKMPSFDETMPGEYDGPHQMLRNPVRGGQRPAPSGADLRGERFRSPQARMSGPTRGNVEDLMVDDMGLHVSGERMTEGPRILNRRPKSMAGRPRGRVLTNLSGQDLQEGAMGGLPDTQFDFTAQGGRKRPADGLDLNQNSAIYTDPQGNSRNSTDAFYENALADSKHRQEMTRLAGRASERSGDGKVRTLGRGPAQGRFAAMARMAGQRRGRQDQVNFGKLKVAEDALALEREKMLMGPNVHPDQAAMWQAQAQKYGAEAKATMTPEQKIQMEKALQKDKGRVDLYEKYANAVTDTERKSAGEALEAYDNEWIYQQLTPEQPEERKWLFGMKQKSPKVEATYGFGPKRNQK